LLRRLKSVDTGYHQDLRYMEGTREILLKNIVAWATNQSGQKNESSAYWVYGLPGIGKTSLAHSTCASLHEGSTLLERFSAGGMTRT